MPRSSAGSNHPANGDGLRHRFSPRSPEVEVVLKHYHRFRSISRILVIDGVLPVFDRCAIRIQPCRVLGLAFWQSCHVAKQRV